MSLDPADLPRGDVIVVEEERHVVHFVWILLLSLTLGGLWAIYAFVEMTDENRIAISVVGWGMTAFFAGAWIYAVRFPDRLEISYEAIVRRRRGRRSSTTLQRTTGELAFAIKSMVIGGHGSVTPVLTIPGEQGPQIATGTFDHKKIRQACESVGWRFVESTEG